MQKNTFGWGKINNEGVEIWDTEPVFLGDRVGVKDWLKLLFYPKKIALYRWIKKNQKRLTTAQHTACNSFRILDVGCGTGAAAIDMKKIFSRGADVVGVDVVKLQVELAREKAKRHGVVASFEWYDGARLPFPDASFDAVYTSDVLGHVAHVPLWLGELNRVLRPGGVLAMFAESSLGRHAWIRRYLFSRGLNADPHAAFHISLFSKNELRAQIEGAGFAIRNMFTVFWPAFFLHPQEFAPALQTRKDFPILRRVNTALVWLKTHTDPFFTAVGELYGLIELYTIGRWVESQGYVILARKK